METGAKLDQRRDASVDANGSGGRLADAGDQLQHRALAGSIAADDAEGLSLGDVEGHALQRFEHRIRTKIAQHAPGQQRARPRSKVLPSAIAALDLVNVAR